METLTTVKMGVCHVRGHDSVVLVGIVARGYSVPLGSYTIMVSIL